MKLVITGGLGFIGSNFIRYLLENYKNDVFIINIDKVTYAANKNNLRDVVGNKSKYYKFYQKDIINYKVLERIFSSEKPEVIINFAAETHVDRSLYESIKFVKSNVLGVQTLLELAYRNKIAKFIHISTDEVFGSVSPPLSADENYPLNPSSPYSASKASAELMIKAFEKTFGYKVIITRSTNNFGPYQYPEKFIPLTIISAILNKPIPIYGNGEQVRDWLYVKDHCKAIDIILQKGFPGKSYNIAGGNERRNIDVAKFIVQYLGKPMELINYVKNRPAHDVRYSLDSSLIKRELGFYPEKNFEEALIETIEWYKNNKKWWIPLLSSKFWKFYKKHYQDNSSSNLQKF